MTDCAACIASLVTGPCPHEAIAAVHRYGREQYAIGLRAGFDALLAVLAAVDGHQGQGKRRPPIPRGRARHALRSQLGHLLRQARDAGLDVDAWQAEARAALDVPAGT